MSTPDRVLVALMKLTGLRQLHLARELGVSRSTLAGWLAGYGPMPDEAVLKAHRAICSRLDRITQNTPYEAEVRSKQKAQDGLHRGA